MNSNLRQDSTAQLKQKTSFNMNSREYDTISLENEFPILINKEDSKANENNSQFTFSSNDSFDELFNPQTMKMGDLKIKEKTDYKIVPLKTSLKQELIKSSKIKECASERLLVQNLLDNTSVYSKPILRRDNQYIVKESNQNYNTNDDTKDASGAKKGGKRDMNSSKEVLNSSIEKKKVKKNLRKSPVNIYKRRKMIMRIQRWWKIILKSGSYKDRRVIRIQSFWRGYFLRKKVYSYIYNYYIIEGSIFHLSNSMKKYYFKYMKSIYRTRFFDYKKHLKEKFLLKFLTCLQMQEKERLVMYKHYKHWLINTVFLDRKENHSPRVVEIQDKNKCLNFLVKRLVHDNVNVLKKQINKWNLSARMCKISRGMLYLLWDKENNYWNIRKMTCFNTWVKKTYNKSLKENEKRKSLRRLYIRMKMKLIKLFKRWKEINKKEKYQEEEKRIDLFVNLLEIFIRSKSFDNIANAANQYIKKKIVKPYCRSRIISVLKENDKTRLIMKYFHIWDKKSNLCVQIDSTNEHNLKLKQLSEFCLVFAKNLLKSSNKFCFHTIHSSSVFKANFYSKIKSLESLFKKISFDILVRNATKLSVKNVLLQVMREINVKQSKNEKERTMICFMKWVNKVSSIKLKDMLIGMVLQGILKSDRISKNKSFYLTKWYDISKSVAKLGRSIHILDSCLINLVNNCFRRELLYRLSRSASNNYIQRKLKNVLTKYNLKGYLKKFKLICENDFNMSYYICQENVKQIVRNTLFLIKEKGRLVKMLRTIKNRHKLAVKDQRNVLLKYFNLWNKAMIKISFKGILIRKNIKGILRKNLKSKMIFNNFFSIWKSNKFYGKFYSDEKFYRKSKLASTIINKFEGNQKKFALYNLRNHLTKNFVLKRLNKIMKSNSIKPFIHNLKKMTKIKKITEFSYIFSRLSYKLFIDRMVYIKENTIRKKVLCPYLLKRTNIRLTLNKPIGFIAYFHHWAKQIIKERLREISFLAKQQNLTLREGEIKIFYSELERKIHNNLKRSGMSKLLEYVIHKRKMGIIRTVIKNFYFVRQFLKWKEVNNTFIRFETIVENISFYIKRIFFKKYREFDKYKTNKKIILGQLKKNIMLKSAQGKVSLISYIHLWSKKALKISNYDRSLKKILRILLINKKINTIVIYFSEWLHKSNLIGIYYNSVQNAVLSLNFLYKKMIDIKLKSHFFIVFVNTINKKKSSDRIFNMLKNNSIKSKQELFFIRRCFNIWKNQNLELIREYNSFLNKARLHFKIIARIKSRLLLNSVKSRFIKWKLGTSELKRFVTFAIFFRKLSKIVKQFSQRITFDSINNIACKLRVEDLKDSFVKKIYSLRNNDYSIKVSEKMKMWRKLNKNAKLYDNLAKTIILNTNSIKKELLILIKEFVKSKILLQTKKKVIKKVVVRQETILKTELNESVKKAFIEWWKTTLRSKILSIRNKKVLKAVYKIKKDCLIKLTDFHFKKWKNSIFPLKSLIKVVRSKPVFFLNFLFKIEKCRIINAFDLIKEKSYHKLKTKIKCESSRLMEKILLNKFISRSFFKLQHFKSKNYISKILLELIEKHQIKCCFNVLNRKFNILAEYLTLQRNYHLKNIIGELCKKFLNSKQFYFISWKNNVANNRKIFKILVQNFFKIIGELLRKNKRKTFDSLQRNYSNFLNNVKKKCLLSLHNNNSAKINEFLKIYFNKFKNLKKKVGRFNWNNTFSLDEPFSDAENDDFNIEINDLLGKKVENIDKRNGKQRKSIKKFLDSTGPSVKDQSESNRSKNLTNSFKSLIVNGQEDFSILKNEIKRVFRKVGYKSELTDINDDLKYPESDNLITSCEYTSKMDQNVLKNVKKNNNLNNLAHSYGTICEMKMDHRNKYVNRIFEIYNKNIRKTHNFWFLYWKRVKPEYLLKIEMIQDNYKKYRRGREVKAAKFECFNKILRRKYKADFIRLKIYFTRLLNNTIHYLYHNYADTIKRFFKNNVKRVVCLETEELEKLDKRKTFNLFTESFFNEEKKKGHDMKLRALKKGHINDTFSEENFSFHLKELDDEHCLSLSSFNHEIENTKILIFQMRSMLLSRYIERKFKKERHLLKRRIRIWFIFTLDEDAKEKYANNKTISKMNHFNKRYLPHKLLINREDSVTLKDIIDKINEKNKAKRLDITENEVLEFVQFNEKIGLNVKMGNSLKTDVIKEILVQYKIKKMSFLLQKLVLNNIISFVSNKLINKQRKLVNSAKLKSNIHVQKIILIQRKIRNFLRTKRIGKIKEYLNDFIQKAEGSKASVKRLCIFAWRKYCLNNILTQASNYIKSVVKEKMSFLRLKRKKAILSVLNKMFSSFLSLKIIKPFFKKFVLKETLNRAGLFLSHYLLKFTLRNILYYSRIKNIRVKRNSILLKKDLYSCEVLQNRFASKLRLNIAASEIQLRYRRHSIINKKSQGLERIKAFAWEDTLLKQFKYWKRMTRALKLLSAAETINKFFYKNVFLNLKLDIIFRKYNNRLYISELIQTLSKTKYKERLHRFYSLINNLYTKKVFLKVKIFCLMKGRILKYIIKNQESYLQRKLRVWIRVVKFDKRKELFFIKLCKFVKKNIKQTIFKTFKLFILNTAINNYLIKCESSNFLKNLKNYSNYRVTNYMLGNILVEGESNIETSVFVYSLYRVYTFKLLSRLIILLKIRCLKYLITKEKINKTLNLLKINSDKSCKYNRIIIRS